ncbi:endonuclease MutS2 [Anaerosporobacter sp.]|uniref:endonuclease MutS2 n=1 Tax=Anaerosporobacter sp. TaxID=1872529 RepID=UPI00286F3D5D|nr:DNA mismatch repair protein MutS [Anaerosporobacter sp.]
MNTNKIKTLDTNLLTLEFDKILSKLTEYAVSDFAKENLASLRPYLKEDEARRKMAETTEGRKLFDYLGNPPLSAMQNLKDILLLCEQDGILLPEQLTTVIQFITSCKRLKRYLERGNDLQLSLTSYAYSIDTLDALYEELNKSIYNNQIDDSASTELRNIRRKIESSQTAIKQKLESLLRSKREYFTDTYVSTRNGHSVLPVKREYKHQVSGSVIDMSATGSTYFIEPTIVSKLQEEISSLHIMEDNEIRKILYILTSFVLESKDALRMNIEIMESLDVIFAKTKLSADLNAQEVTLTTAPTIHIESGKHPLLNPNECVPLTFHMDEETIGIVITGPNTGGKTVALKTVGLLSTMAQCGLHIPAQNSSVIAMHNMVLCDIGDGQSITQNLSTFSAHITNVIHILQTATVESLVLLDELGSGTDPAEGMGIAISILEELRSIPCRFVATTHYPEVKEYVAQTEGLINARMTFDRESLRPLYQLIIGEAGESCALYIAKQLGLPDHMLDIAKYYAYHETTQTQTGSSPINEPFTKKTALPTTPLRQLKNQPSTTQLVKTNPKKLEKNNGNKYHIGDSVIVYPQKILGLVYEPTPNFKGEICVQIRGKKQLVNHKRIKLKTSAADLYPADYDFSVIFDSVELRKTRHQDNRVYKKNSGVEVDIE